MSAPGEATGAPDARRDGANADRAALSSLAPNYGSRSGTPLRPHELDEIVHRLIDRIEQRVVDELERRGRRHEPGVF